MENEVTICQMICDFTSNLKIKIPLVYTQWSEAEYMAANYQKAEELFNFILNNAKTLLDKIKIYGIELEHFSIQKKT